MDKSTIFFSQLLILGAFICMTTAVSVRHKRNVIAEYHALPAPNPEIDQFPHETTCHYYYLVLSEEDITVNKCPDGELFDYIDHKCSRRETARCWSHHFGKMKHHHIPLKSRGQFRCPYAWGKYPDIKDCTKYYVCLSGKVKHKKCAPYEHFDKVSRKCVAAIEGVCADETDVVDSDFKCPRTWGSFSFPKDCSKYYECLEKKPSLRTCPTDTLFHERKEKCLPLNHVHCGSRHNPYIKKEETPTIQEFTHSSKHIKYTAKEKQIESRVTIVSETKMSTIDPNSIVVERIPSLPDAAQTTQSPKKKETKSNVKIDSETKMSTIDPNSIVVERIPSIPKTNTIDPNSIIVERIPPSIPDDTQTTQSPKEKETKSNVKIAFETKNSTTDPNSIIVERIPPSIPDDTQTIQPPKDLMNEEFSGSDSQNLTSLQLNKTELTNLPSKQSVSEETEPLMDANTEIISVNDTDENTDDDSGNTDEFIEISTSEAKTSNSPETKSSSLSEKNPSISRETKPSIPPIAQTVTVVSTQNTEAEIVEIKEQQTTAEPLQATASDECSPKDPTCITEESGLVLRCPAADGLYPYPGDERRFLMCSKSNIHVRYCSGDTIFNLRAKMCIGNLIF